MTDFEWMIGMIGSFSRSVRSRREFTLINVGTDHCGEYHWRFRTTTGEIIVLKMEIEKEIGT